MMIVQGIVHVVMCVGKVRLGVEGRVGSCCPGYVAMTLKTDLYCVLFV